MSTLVVIACLSGSPSDCRKSLLDRLQSPLACIMAMPVAEEEWLEANADWRIIETRCER